MTRLTIHTTGSTSTDTEGPEFQALRANNERLLKSFEDLQKHSRSIEGSLDEKTGLLRTALLEYDNLPEELRQLRSAELLAQIREQIESVLQASPEEKPKSLEATATDITDRLQSGQAALDAAKKVSKHLLEPSLPGHPDSTLLSTVEFHQAPIEEDTVVIARTTSPTRLNVNVSVSLSSAAAEPSQVPSQNKLGRWFGAWRPLRKC